MTALRTYSPGCIKSLTRNRLVFHLKCRSSIKGTQMVIMVVCLWCLSCWSLWLLWCRVHFLGPGDSISSFISKCAWCVGACLAVSFLFELSLKCHCSQDVLEWVGFGRESGSSSRFKRREKFPRTRPDLRHWLFGRMDAFRVI